MNFIIYFFIVILGYLTLAKTTNVEDYSINKIQDLSEIVLEKIPPPATFVLTGSKVKGQFIKSHYISLRVVSAFHSSKDIQVRVPLSLFQKVRGNIGLSIYNLESELSNLENVTTIPGLFFVGNPQLGKWTNIHGTNFWSFYNAYKHLPIELGWENFTPNKKDFFLLQKSREGDVINNHKQLFGINGLYTKKLILEYRYEKNDSNRHEGIKLIRSYFKFKI